MIDAQRYQFTERIDGLGRASILPYLPLTLTNGTHSVEVTALLDTGASVNVLPYEIAVQLGAVWEDQTVPVPLSGNLARQEARGLILTGTVGQFTPVLFAFAWTQSREIPVILGQMNFFAEFNVCFYKHENAFEICPSKT